MEKFLSLSEERQTTITDAAMKSFGSNGYKKTSVSDIAKAAGISKAMVFHYFGTKRSLYFYLINYSSHIIMNEIKDKFDTTITDFFDRITLTSNIKMAVLKKHPPLLCFLKSAFFEKDEDVEADIKALIASSEGESLRNKIVFDGMDTSKFKAGVDIKLVMKMLIWFAEGFMSEFTGKSELDIESFCNEYYKCMDLLKNNLYKEEYL
ncbi:MAG: TetR/AcrR family transcriptional regulator [Anaerocolumna sp.]